MRNPERIISGVRKITLPAEFWQMHGLRQGQTLYFSLTRDGDLLISPKRRRG